MLGHGRGGGGGGFGGFPYRSSHQRGQDGGRGGRGRAGRRTTRGGKKPNESFQTELRIPAEQRGGIVGRGGATAKRLRRRTGASVFVPPQGRDAPVRVSARSLLDLLHSFHEMSHLLSDRCEDLSDAVTSAIPCTVKMKTWTKGSHNKPSTGITVDGQLIVRRRTNCGQHSQLLFKGTVTSNNAVIDATPSATIGDPSQLCAYSVQTALSEEDVATVVDNLRFVDSSVDSCQWFCREVPTNDEDGGDNAAASGNIAGTSDATEHCARCRLVFAFGSEGDDPGQICRAVHEAAH